MQAPSHSKRAVLALMGAEDHGQPQSKTGIFSALIFSQDNVYYQMNVIT